MSTIPDPQHTSTEEPTDPETGSSRRSALRALLVGGGAAAGALAFSRTASAADGDQIVIGGAVQTAQTPTIIDYTGAPISAGPSVLSAGGYAPPVDFPFPAGIGGYGNGSVPNGVHGSTTDPEGFGVVAASLASLPAGEGAVAPAGLAVASAEGPQIVFVPLAGAVEGPTPGLHVAGELYRDAAGTLWFTVPLAGDPADDAPGEDPNAVRFVKLAGTESSGSYHAIVPQRVYDSRQAGYPVNGLLEPNQDRVVSVADGRDGGGAVILPDAVPAGATAVLINLTIDGPTGGNFLQVTDGDTTSTETSVLNWSPGTVQLANSITVPVNAAREIRVYCGNQSGSTHVLVDVFGYYL